MKTLIAMFSALPLAAAVQMVSTDAHAATCDLAVDGNQRCTGQIREFYVYGDTSSLRAEVRLDSDTAPWGCTLSATAYWAVGASNENIIKTILSAYLAGTPITLRAVAGTSTCTVQWVSLGS